MYSVYISFPRENTFFLLTSFVETQMTSINPQVYNIFHNNV